MKIKKVMSDTERARVLSEIHRDLAQREASYRGRALAMFPHLCASCGREFEGKRLKELTVHHKDHNHDNNPPDGSNWELLCIYCHDHEHEKDLVAGHGSGGSARPDVVSPSIFTPLAGLDALFPSPPDDENSGDADQGT